MDLIFSGFTTDRILINLQSKFFNASAPTVKIYVGALNIKPIGKFDFNKRIPQGFYWCRNLGTETINPPSSEYIACVILSFGSCELIIGVDIRFYCGRYTSSAGVLGNWNIFLQ